MAIQTLNTIKNWFKTSLKPSQLQFWDTWDSFRHKLEKVPVKDIAGIDELLNDKADKSDFKTINGEEITGAGDIIIQENSQDLQSVLNNGKTWISENSAFHIDHPVLGFDYQGSNGKNIFTLRPEFLSIAVKDSDLNNSSSLFMEKPAEGQVLDFKLPNTKSTGQYTIATLDDIAIANDSQTLEQTLIKGNTDTTGNSIIMKKDWNKTEVKFDSISMSYGKEDYGFDYFTLASSGDGGYIDYTDMYGNGNFLDFKNTNGDKKSFNFPSDSPFISSTLAVREDITLQKALENNSEGIVQQNIRFGYEKLDKTSFSTITMRESSWEEETGIDILTSGALDINAKKINLTFDDPENQEITVNGKHIVRTVNGIDADAQGNIILSDLGDMTTSTNQEVLGVKTFLNSKLALRNIANTFSSFLSNSNTASRTYTLQDVSGTLMLSDAENSNLTGYGEAVQLLSANGTPIRGGNIVNLFSFVQATPVTLNSTTLNSILTGTMFGNTTLISNTNSDNPMLTMGKSFSGRMFGYISAISSETIKMVLKIGSTTLLDSNLLVIPSTLVDKSFEINYSFTVLSEGAAGTMIANLNIIIDGMNIYSISGDPVNIDTTMNRVFDIQFAYGSINAGNSITFKMVKGSNDVN